MIAAGSGMSRSGEPASRVISSAAGARSEAAMRRGAGTPEPASAVSAAASRAIASGSSSRNRPSSYQRRTWPPSSTRTDDVLRRQPRDRAVGRKRAEHRREPVDDLRGQRRQPRAPGPSRRRPRTHAARTMSGCARKMRRDARSAGSSSAGPPVERRDEGRIDRDDVGLLADLERAGDVAEPERPGPVERAEPEPVERPEDGPASTPATFRAFWA